jgi:Uma2 family endonuclease
MTENMDIIGRRKQFKKYTAREFFEFAQDRKECYELIQGQIRLMASPSPTHQKISREIAGELRNYLKGKTCQVFYSPLDVVLFEKDKNADDSQNVFQPDVFVVCDPNKITDKRIVGAPDFIVEIVSPSNSEHDYKDKLNIYMNYGVREYWIVNPDNKKILTYIKDEKNFESDAFTFEDKIKVRIFDDFEIDFKELNIK